MYIQLNPSLATFWCFYGLSHVHFRFTNIATAVIDYEEEVGWYLTPKQENHTRAMFNKLIKARSRVILLHVK